VHTACHNSSPSADALYTAVTQWRTEFNRDFPDCELYLEDVWNETVSGETHIETILRSRKTLNETPPLVVDIYHNRQDSKGVWHLEAYQTTRMLAFTPTLIIQFLGTEATLSQEELHTLAHFAHAP